MSQELRRGLGGYFHAGGERRFEETLRGNQQDRPQTVDEIASAALLLVPNSSIAITGQTLTVDGGMTFYRARPPCCIPGAPNAQPREFPLPSNPTPAHRLLPEDKRFRQ